MKWCASITDSGLTWFKMVWLSKRGFDTLKTYNCQAMWDFDIDNHGFMDFHWTIHSTQLAKRTQDGRLTAWPGKVPRCVA